MFWVIGKRKWSRRHFRRRIHQTKDVDKGTDEMEYMKKLVVTIRRKGLDKYEGQSKGSTGWFKLDSWFF